MDPPDDATSNQVIAIAREPFDIDAWTRLAQQGSLGEHQLQPLLGVMVHPPDLPAGMNALDWVARCQLAAALLIARLDSGWEQSSRRAALRSLALGPVDWSVTAAIIALTQLGRSEPLARPEIGTLFEQLLRQMPDTGYCCYEHALVCNWQQLPELEAQRRRELWRRRRRIEQR